MSPTATTTTTQEVKLSPTVRRKVLTELKTYTALNEQMKVLKAAMQARKDGIQRLFETADAFDALVDGVTIEGFKAKYVASTRKVLEKTLLIKMGVTAEMLDEATVEKPSKPYLKLTLPGEHNGDEE